MYNYIKSLVKEPIVKYYFVFLISKSVIKRGPTDHITCTWVQCATFLTDRPGPPFLYSDQPDKNANLVGDVEILLHGNFRWIVISEKKLKMSQPMNDRAAILFFQSAWKHKPGRGRLDLASRHVSLNSLQQFPRRSRQRLSQSEATAVILFFRSAWKTQTWYRTLGSCFP